MHYIYPGSFDPPHYGHVTMARRMADMFPFVKIVCSRNPNKNDSWFTPEIAVKLWHSYVLPENVDVLTFDEIAGMQLPTKDIILMCGIRNEQDLHENIGMVELNHKLFGIDKYVYIYNDAAAFNISSSLVRQSWDNWDKLLCLVSEDIARQVRAVGEEKMNGR